MLLMSVLMMVLTGLENLPGIILINLMALGLLGLKLNISKMGLPFSMELVPGANKKLSDNFLFMGIVGGLAAVHYFILTQNLWLTGMALIILLVSIRILFAKARLGNRK
jgi:hypothetical protein